MAAADGRPPSDAMDITSLMQAVQSLNAEDAFRVRFGRDQWRIFAQYLVREEIRSGELLIRQGDVERILYLLEQGSLQVFATGGAPGSSRIAILRAGSVVGEPAIFGEVPRMANVEAMTPCIVWSLRGTRFDEMVQRSPGIAMEVLRAAGAVLAARMRANLARHAPIS